MRFSENRAENCPYEGRHSSLSLSETGRTCYSARALCGGAYPGGYQIKASAWQALASQESSLPFDSLQRPESRSHERTNLRTRCFPLMRAFGNPCRQSEKRGKTRDKAESIAMLVPMNG